MCSRSFLSICSRFCSSIFLFKIIFQKYTHDKINILIIFKGIIQWCNHHHPSLELFSFCKAETLGSLNNNCLCHLPTLPGSHHSIFCLYFCLGSSYKHDICALRLPYFIEHNVLEVYPCCSKCQNFLPFYG